MDYEGYVQAQYDEALEYAKENVSDIDIILEAISNFKGNPENSDLEYMEDALSRFEDYTSAISDMIKYGTKAHNFYEKANKKWEENV